MPSVSCNVYTIAINVISQLSQMAYTPDIYILKNVKKCTIPYTKEGLKWAKPLPPNIL